MTMLLNPTSRAAARFAHDEDGAGTVFGLFLFMVFVILGGVALDSSNAWRNSTHLNASADSAAHAGAVALANGGDLDDVRAMAQAAAVTNMPQQRYGTVVGNAVNNIQLMHFDTATRELSSTGTLNAVVVDLGQTATNANAVRTYFLRLMGVNSWDVTGRSIAVYDASAECNNTDGIYAEDEVSLSSQNSVGSGFCVHSQHAVWLPQQNSFGPGSMVSMPNLADCKSKCTQSANPGINPMAINMILPDFRDYIENTYDAFNASSSALKSAWFSQKGLTGINWTLNIKPLKDAGVVPKNKSLDIGSVVTMTWDQFHAMPALPRGLVYNIDCPNNGNSSKTRLTFNATTGVMDDSALLTDCSIRFDDGAMVLGSLVVTIREQSTATVTSGSKVTVADPTKQCNNADRTTVMALGKVSAPAEFVMSNVTLVSDDDVDIASATSSGVVSRGLSIYATGKVSLSSQHTLEVCGGTNLLAPEGKVIRHVMASAANL
ncbi:TadE/TadG family type IV pilus assembly protein [Palleronia sp. KMU-117]|uniref:TadE/TadG family type IV pilus assembly protein n=1 Tax=Palleronia sp. KMU-117 TaxID=3434108 RepID=UPI003D702EA3